MKVLHIDTLSSKKRVVFSLIALFLIIAIAIAATFAWLWSRSNLLQNEFTRTNNLTVDISETARQYIMMPNTPIAKDPSVHIDAELEPSYVFLDVTESATLSDYVDYYIHPDWQQYGSFVVDGKLDSMYDNADGSHRAGWYFNSAWPDYPGLEAYYSDAAYHSGDVNNSYYNKNATFAQTYQPLADVLANGVDSNRAQHAMELWVAYDHNYVYLYAKIYDNDYYENRGVYIGSNTSDYFGIYWDPDPKSRENVDYSQYPDIFTETVLTTNTAQQFNHHDDVPIQGDGEVKLFPGKTKNEIYTECNTANLKAGYGNNTMENYFETQSPVPNVVFFEFYGDIKGNAAAKDTLGGYGYEIRLPRNNSYYDTTNGKPYFKLNVAATNYNSEYSEQMTLSFGQAFWLWYGSMLPFALDDANNPFFPNGETGVYYKTVGDWETNTPTANTTIPVLRSGACFGNEFRDGYVYVKDNVTDEMLENLTAANSNVTLQFNTHMIQQAHLTLDEAYHTIFN